jgi:formylglycine-generating enzyme required for sulfatase activity
VTQGQWQQVMGSNPSYFAACGSDCPVETVSWDDAQLFIEALNTSEGRTDCGPIPNTCYTLPTESQWEYAARGGTVTAFYSGDITYTDCTVDSNLDAIGWYCGNASSTTHPVAQKAPNNWGLYDMSGNVFEWCSDWYGTYPAGPVADPVGAATGSFRVTRGGSWDKNARYARSAYRNINTPGNRDNNLGFRLVLPPGQ